MSQSGPLALLTDLALSVGQLDVLSLLDWEAGVLGSKMLSF